MADEGDSGTPAGDGDGASRVARNIGAMAGGQVVTWSMSLLWTLVVPRALGPAGMGIVVTAWSVTGVLGVVLGLGTRNYLVREMVVRREDSSRLLGTAIVLRVALAPLFALAALAYLRFANVGGDARIVLWLAVAATILTQVAEPLQAAFQALERMEYLAYSDVISKSAQGLLGVVLAVAGFGAVAITGCWAAMAAVVVVLDVVWLRGRVPVVLRTNAARLAEHGAPERRLLGLRVLLHDLPLGRRAHALAPDAPRGRRLVRRPDEAVPDVHVPAGRDLDRVAAAPRPRVRRRRGGPPAPDRARAGRAHGGAEPADRRRDRDRAPGRWSTSSTARATASPSRSSSCSRSASRRCT